MKHFLKQHTNTYESLNEWNSLSWARARREIGPEKEEGCSAGQRHIFLVDGWTPKVFLAEVTCHWRFQTGARVLFVSLLCIWQ